MQKKHFPENTPSPFAWFLLILLSIIWGSSFILIKKGLEVFSPAQVSSIRVSTAFLALSIFAVFMMKGVSLKKWVFLFISGFFGVFVPAFLFSQAQMGLSSSLTGVFNALTPLFTLIIGTLFFRQPTSLQKIPGILLGLLGAVFLMMIGSKDGQLSFNYYALYVVSATVLYGINVNLIKVYLSELKPVQISALSLFVVGPLALFSIFFTQTIPTYQSTEGSTRALLYIICLGVMATAIAITLFNRLLQISTPIFASSVTYLIPIVAMLWGAADGERLLLSHYACTSLIIFGVWLVNKKK